MSHLPTPIRKVFDDLDDEAADARILLRWRNAYEARRKRQRVVTASTVAVAAAATVGLLVTQPWRTPAAGPLLREDGAAPGVVAAEARPMWLRLRDRSQIEVWRGELTVTENSGHTFATRLDRGGVRVEVTPHGPRRWSVLCEGVLVEVTGTVFEVEREPDAVRVSVSRGSVRVSGRRVPESPRALRAGQSLRVSLVDPPFGPPAPERDPGARAVPNVDAPNNSPAVRGSVQPPSPPTRQAAEHAANGQVEPLRLDERDRADVELGVVDSAQEPSAGELLTQAEHAVLADRFPEAVSLFERIIREHPGTHQAPQAASELGHLELQLGHPERAAETFSQALRLGVPGALEEDVRAQLFDACFRMGDAECAREAAEGYLRRFPNGRYAERLRRQREPQ
jgi:hypothetical protein